MVEKIRSGSSKFWHATSRYGLVHTAIQGSINDSSSLCLIVYVHGLFGDARQTWGQMPRWVLENAGVDLDVISFAYPSKFWQRSSIAQAAYHLRTWLETEFDNHHNIIFITHSCGGLVVKHLLNQSFASIVQNEQTRRSGNSSSMSLWTRTRQIVNIAVPHEGGTRAMSVLSTLVYPLFYFLSAPLLLLTKTVTQGEWDWGRNRIITGLRRKNRWLSAMQCQFLRCLQESKNAGLPTPAVNEICAESDQSVAASDRSVEQIYVRGTHKSVKIPNRSQGPIVGIAADIIKKYPKDVSLAIVVNTLHRINEVNTAASICSLIGGQNNGGSRRLPGSVGGIAAANAGSQQSICAALRKAILQARLQSQLFVLTGSAGVGKSAVMRAVAGQLGCRFLRDPGFFPLPLFVPLQQMTLKPESTATYFWESMWTWWIQWANSLSPRDSTSLQWLDQKFGADPIVVVIDGVDDFLANHPEIGFSAFADVIHRVVERYAMNDRFKIVVSLRKDTQGLHSLIRNPNAVFEVLPLSVEQAILQFPHSGTWLPAISDTAVLEQIMTPLLLSHYQPTVDVRPKIGAMTQTRILSEVIENFLIETQLVGTRLAGGGLVELGDLFTSLGIIAWLLFYKSRGEISLQEVVQESSAIEERLKLRIGSPDRVMVMQNLRAGCALLENWQVLDTLFKRTVFIATRPGQFRFIHRAWQELLVAKFLIDLISGHWFSELANAKMYSAIYRIAGELYQGEAISDDQVRGALDAWRNTDQRFITGNFIGFLSWTKIPIEAQAIRHLLDELQNLDGLSRIILIGGLGYRLLVDDAQDTAHSDLRRYLLPVLGKLSNSNAIQDDPVLSSLAWCYQKAFAALFGVAQPLGSFPRLGFGEDHTSIVVPIISSHVDNQYSLDDRSRALQRAFLTPVLDTFKHPMFVIRAVHYLYYLVSAKKHNVLDQIASQELKLLLVPGCEFESLVRSFDLVPDLQELYQCCQQAYDQAENSWPTL